MYAVMLETDYVKKKKFNENFFGDWKKILGKNHVIQDFSKCDFQPIYEWHLGEMEKKKQMSTEVSIPHYRILASLGIYILVFFCPIMVTVAYFHNSCSKFNVMLL